MGHMGWEGFLQTERIELTQRGEGHLRRALGVTQAGETTEQLDRIGERDRARAERGLVAIVDEDGAITHEHIDDLSRLDMGSRTAAERVTVEWLQERVECARKGTSAPPVPEHLPGTFSERREGEIHGGVNSASDRAKDFVGKGPQVASATREGRDTHKDTPGPGG